MSADATQMRDELGGWGPSIMSLYTCGYLILDEAPPTRGHEAGLHFVATLFLTHSHVVCSLSCWSW